MYQYTRKYSYFKKLTENDIPACLKGYTVFNISCTFLYYYTPFGYPDGRFMTTYIRI